MGLGFRWLVGGSGVFTLASASAFHIMGILMVMGLVFGIE